MEQVARALDLSALSKASVRPDPWPWATYRGAFRPDVLEATFPGDHFSYHAQRRILEAMGKKGTDAWYQHNVRTRPLLELGEKEPFQPDTLHPAWLDVAKDLVSQDFRECLSDVAQHDVRQLDMQAHFWEFLDGAFFQPHVDKPHKIVTILLYLTKDWSEEYGGSLQILGSGDPGDIRHTVSPEANNAVVLKREPDSWHSVSRIPVGLTRTRILLQAWFWEKQ